MFASRELRKTVHRVRNKEVGRGRGPTSGANDVMKILWNIALLVGCKAARLALDVWLPDNADPALAYGLEAAAGFTALRVLFFASRRFLLRLLLRCQPWARQRQQQTPLASACWEASLAILQPGNATTAYLQQVLPSLPRPGPVRALKQYLDCLAATASASAKDAVVADVQDILLRGPEDLERDLDCCIAHGDCDWAWSCTWKDTLVHDDSHLLGRCFFLLDREVLPEGTQGRQMMRAAVLTMRLLDFMKRVGNSDIPCRGLMSRANPMPKIVPRSVHVFDTLFATTVEPIGTTNATVNRRSLQHCSNHIVVLSHGQAVEVPIRDVSGARVSEGQLLKLLVSAEAAAKRRKNACTGKHAFDLDALSWLSWSEWSEAIVCLEIDKGVKLQHDSTAKSPAIEKMWSAALVLALDESLPSWPQALDNLSNRALSLLLGPSPACQGRSRWRGAFCLVVQPDGYAGLCCTLPLAEPWAASQMWEFALARERYPISTANAEVEVATPRCIRTQVRDAETELMVTKRVESAQMTYARVALGVSLRVLVINNLGWHMLKALQVDPTALLHLAAQIALYRVQGTVSMALDSVATPLFSGGRSDWAWTTTTKVVEFLMAFCEDVHQIQKKGCDQHRSVTRSLLVDCCNALENLRHETVLGHGFYRFLLALRGSTSSSHRRALFESILPRRHRSDGAPAVGLSTILWEVQADPKTSASQLSLGGGGGFCAAGSSAASCCRVSVSPVGDDRLVLHVMCSPADVETRILRTSACPGLSRNVKTCQEHLFNDAGADSVGSVTDKFLDSGSCRSHYPKAHDYGESDRAGEASTVSADAVAQEMQRALHGMVDLLQLSTL